MKCRWFDLVLVLVLAAVPVTSALGQIGPDGYDFLTIGNPGNGVYDRPDLSNGHLVTGRGSVPWLYKIGRTEITTGQWVEFFNALYGRETPISFGFYHGPYLPAQWGAEEDPTYHGPGIHYRPSPSIPNAAMLPVSATNWRTAAVLCNWLHNNKSTDPSAFMSGAYDVSTFYDITGNGDLADQRRHSPGARYWIPTIDEWMKAAFYDPNKTGQGQGGWWLSPNRTDDPIIGGIPGIGQANKGFVLPGGGQYLIPLGAYPGTLSAYGMLDAAGATSENVEDGVNIFRGPGVSDRYVFGSSWVTNDGDEPYGLGIVPPNLTALDYGFRIAAAVPSTGTLSTFAFVLFLAPRKRK